LQDYFFAKEEISATCQIVLLKLRKPVVQEGLAIFAEKFASVEHDVGKFIRNRDSGDKMCPNPNFQAANCKENSQLTFVTQKME
jgi:hypothetical protein